MLVVLVATAYTALDCYARWKFRALLDGGGYKVHNDTVPLCDNGAEFYAVIGVGTPPQQFYVQVPTAALFDASTQNHQDLTLTRRVGWSAG